MVTHLILDNFLLDFFDEVVTVLVQSAASPASAAVSGLVVKRGCPRVRPPRGR